VSCPGAQFLINPSLMESSAFIHCCHQCGCKEHLCICYCSLGSVRFNSWQWNIWVKESCAFKIPDCILIFPPEGCYSLCHYWHETPYRHVPSPPPASCSPIVRILQLLMLW
jgi:hypothetical protein